MGSMAIFIHWHVSAEGSSPCCAATKIDLEGEEEIIYGYASKLTWLTLIPFTVWVNRVTFSRVWKRRILTSVYRESEVWSSHEIAPVENRLWLTKDIDVNSKPSSCFVDELKVTSTNSRWVLIMHMTAYGIPGILVGKFSNRTKTSKAPGSICSIQYGLRNDIRLRTKEDRTAWQLLMYVQNHPQQSIQRHRAHAKSWSDLQWIPLGSKYSQVVLIHLTRMKLTYETIDDGPILSCDDICGIKERWLVHARLKADNMLPWSVTNDLLYWD